MKDEARLLWAGQCVARVYTDMIVVCDDVYEDGDV